MDRRNRDRDRERRDRKRYDDMDRRQHKSERRRDRSRSKRRSTSRAKSSRKSNSRSRYDRDRSRSRSRHENRRRSRSNSKHGHRKSKKESKNDVVERKKSTPPPPNVSIVESVSYSRKDKDLQPKESSPDMISHMEKRNKNPGAYCNLKLDEPIDKEKIHKEIEEKLRETLAREGIEYNAPKPEATHPVFANDGSFLEIFKKMQEAQNEIQTSDPHILQQQQQLQQPSTSTYAPPVLPVTSNVPRPQMPIFGRRRGGKILKTGVVAKPKLEENGANTDPKDFWSIYLREVNKYKNAACDSDSQSRPLVK